VRPTDSPDGTAGKDQPPGLPETDAADRPAAGDGSAASGIAAGTSAGGTSAGAPAAGGPAPAGPAATKTLDKIDQKDSGKSGRARAPGRASDLLGRAITGAGGALGPVARNLRRLGPARAAAASGAQVGDAAQARPGEAAAAALARLTGLPAILVVAWLLPGLPLLLGGSFLPVPMLLISVPLAAALTVNCLREVPATWPRSGAAGTSPRAWAAWFGLLATVAVVAGLVAWQIREASESVIVLRDAGTYLQAGYWVAQHGALPIPQQLAAFGGAHPGMTFASNGFLSRGGSLFPAVTPGMPMLLAAGFWAHGITGAEAVGPILGGLAALTFAGIVARLVGPQWAPAGALLLGLCLPQQYVSRSTLSETALEVVLFGGLCLLADSLLVRSGFRFRTGTAPSAAGPDGMPSAGSDGASAAGPDGALAAGSDGALAGGPDGALAGGPAGAPAAHRTARGDWAARVRQLAKPARWTASLTSARILAGLAGLAIGLSLLMSLDGLIYLLPVIPFGAMLMIGRRPQAIPFVAGFVLGGAYGVAGLFLLDRPFLDTVGETAAIAGVAAVWLLALSVVAGQLSRISSVRRIVPRLLAKIPLRWLPEFGGLIAAAALIGFAVRPYVQTVRGHPSAGVASFIAGLQRLQGLPVDPDRLYSEQTLYWVIWYIGLPTVLLGGVGIAALVRNCLRALITWSDRDARWRIWALPLAIICVGSAVVLWQPDIVADQPWASQRLVVMVLPGLIVCAIWSASWLTVRARSRGARPMTAGVVGLFCAAAMVVPTVATTFGLGISHSGRSGGLQPVAQGIALQRIGAGQAAAVTSFCAQIPRKASVVIISPGTASEFSQVVRGMCGDPVVSMAGQPASTVNTVLGAITAKGRRPVLLADSAGPLTGFGGDPVRVLNLATTADPHDLTQLPTAPTKARYVVWMTIPAPSAVGA
jgi:hypothetical protein